MESDVLESPKLDAILAAGEVLRRIETIQNTFMWYALCVGFWPVRGRQKGIRMVFFAGKEMLLELLKEIQV